jgi:hypothetical protein
VSYKYTSFIKLLCPNDPYGELASAFTIVISKMAYSSFCNTIGITYGSHADIFTEIFNEFEFENTFYKNEIPPDKYLVKAYGDIDSVGQLEDISKMQFETTTWFIGDDGVMASLTDGAKFIKALIKGKILDKEYTNEMFSWVMPDDPDYGLGLMYANKCHP